MCEQDYIKWIDKALRLKTEKGFKLSMIRLQDAMKKYVTEVDGACNMVESYHQSSLSYLLHLHSGQDLKNIEI